MGDLLDKELSKPADEIDIDKIDNYLASIADADEVKWTEKEIRDSFKVFRKRYFKKKPMDKAKTNTLRIRRRIMAAAVFVVALILTELSVHVIAEVSLFSRISSLFDNDEYTIVEGGYIDENPTISKDDNALIEFSELLLTFENTEYLAPFEDYIIHTYHTMRDTGDLYTLVCQKDGKEFHIRLFKMNNVELAKLSFESQIIDINDTIYINEQLYYYMDEKIIYYDNEYCIYNFILINMDDLEQILIKK